MLNTFVTSCHRSPAARVPVAEFLKAFRLAHPEAVTAWPRGRVVAELAAAGYRIGYDRRQVAWIIGLSVDDGPTWTVRESDGRLVSL
jgi:hypothetical protein